MVKTYKAALEAIVAIADEWMDTEGASDARALVRMAAEAQHVLDGIKGPEWLRRRANPQGTPADEGSIPSRSTTHADLTHLDPVDYGSHNTRHHEFRFFKNTPSYCRFPLYQDEQCGAGPFALIHIETRKHDA